MQHFYIKQNNVLVLKYVMIMIHCNLNVFLFKVLYTHQKTKKSKVWQDGVLKTTVGGNKVKDAH